MLDNTEIEWLADQARYVGGRVADALQIQVVPSQTGSQMASSSVPPYEVSGVQSGSRCAHKRSGSPQRFHHATTRGSVNTPRGDPEFPGELAPFPRVRQEYNAGLIASA